MKPPTDTNSLPQDLAARFAALRSRAKGPSPPNGTTDTDLEERLKRLEPPTEAQVEQSVPIEIKPPTTLNDEAVETFLKSLSTPLEPEPLSSSSAAHRRIPTLSDGSLDASNGIEVEFMKRPSLGEEVGGIGGEEDELLKRIRDELTLEDRENKRNEQSVDKWDERIKGLRGVVPGVASASDERIRKDLGDAPGLGQLEKELRRRKKKREKEKRDSETESESETDSETESENSDDEDERE